MLFKCDIRVNFRLPSNGVPPQWDIPTSLPSPAAGPGYHRFQLAGTGEPRFHGLIEA